VRWGAAVSLISDGDVAGVTHTADPDKTGIDIYLGIGGAPEGVLAAALRCIGGQMQTRLVLDTEEKRERDAKMGIKDPRRKYQLEDMIKGECLFAATGVTDGRVLRGVQFGREVIETETVVMRSTSGTIRWISAEHRQVDKFRKDRAAFPRCGSLGITRFDPDSLNQIASQPLHRVAVLESRDVRTTLIPRRREFGDRARVARPARRTRRRARLGHRAASCAARTFGPHHRRAQRRGGCGRRFS
jgi:hypothetical protein